MGVCLQVYRLEIAVAVVESHVQPWTDVPVTAMLLVLGLNTVGAPKQIFMSPDDSIRIAQVLTQLGAPRARTNAPKLAQISYLDCTLDWLL